MLYRKTTKAVSAAILTVMALLGVSAHATINLDAAGTAASPVGTVTFSRETLGNLPSGTTHHSLYVNETGAVDACDVIGSSSTSTSLALAVRTTLGMRIPASSTRYVRLDLTNMRFRGALSTADDVCIDGGTLAIEVGGARTDSHVVLAVTAGAEIAATEGVAFALHDLLEITAGAADASFTYSAYTDLGNAVGRANALKTRTRTGVLVRSSVTAKVTRGAAAAVADVGASPRFTDFVGGGSKPLGTVAVTLNMTHLKAVTGGGTVATLRDVIRTGAVYLTAPGGLGFGTFSIHTAADCSGTGAAVTVATTGDNVGRGSASVAVGTRTVCVAQRKIDHDKNSETPTVAQEIPETDIMGAMVFAKNTTAQFAPAAVAATTIGSIERNGTTVRLPYLTTFEGYNQRLIIVNRSGVEADYELTFTTEAGTEATPGHMAEGKVAAGSTLVIPIGNAVTMTGRSRTSATLAVVAPNHLVDVATTVVNIEDGSTDTINYDTN